MKIYAPTARAARRVECPRPNGAPNSAPANFDATANPIISRHWFGIEPFRTIGAGAAEVRSSEFMTEVFVSSPSCWRRSAPSAASRRSSTRSSNASPILTLRPLRRPAVATFGRHR